MDLKECIEKSAVVAKFGRYAYLKVKEPTTLDNHFMITQDDDEITVVTREENIKNLNPVEVVGFYRLIEFKCANPFNACGFLEAISGSISKNNSCCLIVSTFSKDYCLVKEEKLEIALKAFAERGFKSITVE